MTQNLNKDALAKKHLEELDAKHGQNIDPVEIDANDEEENPKIVKRGNKRVLLENEDAYGKGEDRFDFGNRTSWVELPMAMLPSKGMFYPNGAAVYIKSAEVTEVKHWSTMDVNSFLDVDSKMNFVLERCLNFANEESKISYLWNEILEIDRLYIMFRINELTFPGKNNKLQLTFSCTSACKAPRGEQGQYKKKSIITSSDLNLLKLDEYLLRLYNPEHKCFLKRTKDGNDLKFYLPSTGVASAIKNLIVDLREKNETIDPYIIKLLPYLINNYKDVTAATLRKLSVDTQGWDTPKVMFINGVVEKIEESVKLTVEHKCEKCPAVLEVPLFFREGPSIKDLFFVSDGLDDLI